MLSGFDTNERHKITIVDQTKKKIMKEPTDDSKPYTRGGLWGWILIAISAAFALPNSLLRTYATSTGHKSQSYHNLISSLKCMNPLKWIRNFAKTKSNDSESTASPTTFLDSVELAKYYGYNSERHKVTTEDGYILEIHRLPSGRNVTADKNAEDAATPRPAVLIHHAYLTTSRELLILGPKKALAFFLADAGYDVWLCNARGNTYSRNHTTLKPSQSEFWNFSFHEHGTQDLPATINYVLKENGGGKLDYIGYSMGTTAFFVMASERPEMLDKIKTFTGMGPVKTTANCRSKLLRFAMRTAEFTVASLKFLGMYEFLPHYKWITYAGQTVCGNGRWAQKLCVHLILYPLGGKSTTMKNTFIPEMLAHTPSGTSIKTFTHFAQGFRTGELRKFDYGEKKNMERYRSKIPPLYNLQALNVPVQLYYGMNDLMADFTDAEYLRKILPNVFACEKVSDDTFTHLDFMWSEAARIILYPKILEGIKKFENIGGKVKDH